MNEEELKEFLNLIDQGEEVSRWDAYRQQKQLRILCEKKEFKHLKYKLEDLIGSAKESL